MGIFVETAPLSLLDGSDAVSQFTGQFVLLMVDSLFHLILELFESKLAFRGPVLVLRCFSGVAGGPMDVHQERFEIFLESNIVVGASEASPFSELGEGDSAHGALFFIDRGQFLRYFLEFQLLREHFVQRRGRVGGSLLIEEIAGVLFAEVKDRRTIGVG